MVDSEYNMEIYKFSKISFGTVMKKLEMLTFVCRYLKAKKLRYFPGQYKAEQMCD